MDGQAIASVALSHAGLRKFATEFGGPRPAGVREAEITRGAAEPRSAPTQGVESVLAAAHGPARATRP
jgi:hypothetical protein